MSTLCSEQANVVALQCARTVLQLIPANVDSCFQEQALLEATAFCFSQVCESSSCADFQDLASETLLAKHCPLNSEHLCDFPILSKVGLTIKGLDAIELPSEPEQSVTSTTSSMGLRGSI